jgi:xanthine dehydrogenase accessory factor
MKGVSVLQQLDLQVIRQGIEWMATGQPVWLCTVIASFGSSPRPPGALLVARGDGSSCGSLSGGCIEDDFLQRVAEGGFAEPIACVRYGDGSDAPQVRLPCGGVLEVLVERLEADPHNLAHLRRLESALLGRGRLIRQWQLPFANPLLLDDAGEGPRVERHGAQLRVRFGAAQRLIIAGVSSVGLFCAQFAAALDFEVIICEPREEFQQDPGLNNVRLEPILPARYIAEGGCHHATAVVALTHDPRLDDPTMMEAVHSPAFYIGVMGSQKTSEKRMERLQRIAGMDAVTLARIHAPIGLALGSKTPAEIALAVLADIVRVRNGIARERV